MTYSKVELNNSGVILMKSIDSIVREHFLNVPHFSQEASYWSTWNQRTKAWNL